MFVLCNVHVHVHLASAALTLRVYGHNFHTVVLIIELVDSVSWDGPTLSYMYKGSQISKQ